MIVMKQNWETKRIMKIKKKAGHRHMTSFQIIILGFMGVILAGSLLLMLPWASRSGRWSSFSDTLFTATSAVCVTGLVVQDTATYWSEFGQVIILLVRLRSNSHIAADPDWRSRRCDCGSIDCNDRRQEDRTDAEKYHAGSNRSSEDGRDCEDDYFYLKNLVFDRTDRGSSSVSGFLQRIWTWQRNLVRCISCDICILQCRI